MKSWILASLLLAGLSSVAFAQEVKRGQEGNRRNERQYPPKMEGCREEIYKTIDNVKLRLYIFAPEKASNAPAIVFFFGGGWQSGTPQQFEVQCRELAKRGMVAITADYRVASRHQVKPIQCVADARSAIRWVRSHSTELGIDPNKIAAAGGSAGGHLAACTPFIEAFDEAGEDKTISAVPNALVLFNPAVVLAPMEGFTAEGFGTRVPEERMGTKPINISPGNHIKTPAPPTIIFHGKEDTTVPLASVEAFTKKMKSLEQRCDLFSYDGQKHGFFNNDKYRKITLQETDKFLVSLGWLTEKK
jgi:acetyl esterase